VQELEEEVQELKRKLERADSRVKEGTSGSLSREVALERELNEASEKINKLKAEKEQLDASVQELQRRLTELESTATATSTRRQSVMSIVDGSVHSRDNSGRGGASNSMEAALRRGEREKQMEMLLQKAKRDKDKAIRIIVQLIGKEKINSFLNHNAGAADILDKLLDTFGSNNKNDGSNLMSPTRRSAIVTEQSPPASPSPHKGPHSPNKTSNSKNNNSAQKAKAPPAQYRSRINEYYRTTLTGRDL